MQLFGKAERAQGILTTYALFFVLALGLAWVTRAWEFLPAIFQGGEEGFYLSLGLLFLVGYLVNYFAPKTGVPSFVWAIVFGIALQPLFFIFTQDKHALLIVVELLAAFVLFGGGVEVPFKNFKKFFAPIATISLVGTLITIFLFAYSLELFVPLFDLAIPSIALLLTAAILSSIDPTAIIPTLKNLRLKKPFLRDIAVSESAVNDVAGTIITRFFLVAALAFAGSSTVFNEFLPLLSKATLETLALEIMWGVGVGIFGAWMLARWSHSVAQSGQDWSDPALFFSVPIFMYALGSLVGGSGFLAAFVAGLLYDGEHETASVRHFFETFVDGFIKPVIFILLGAIVPLGVLAGTAGIGIVAAFVFMFAIRPLVVFVSLMPWLVREGALFEWRELVFLSFIRETGAIPAVLILVAVSAGVVASEYIFAIGMWVIMLTLLIEPPLTPWLARKLGVAR
ncbi:hypothetical protein GVX82_00810 [Patescibacteria group bacterium]|jgi:cell volume regulation protein A|nr:hypothetical protein [Patescibacteria group bacterium]